MRYLGLHVGENGTKGFTTTLRPNTINQKSELRITEYVTQAIYRHVEHNQYIQTRDKKKSTDTMYICHGYNINFKKKYESEKDVPKRKLVSRLNLFQDKLGT